MFKVRVTIVLIFLFVIGVVLTVQGVSDVIKINGYVPDFNYDSMADVKKGGFVQGYVANIYDCYASESSHNRFCRSYAGPESRLSLPAYWP